MLYYKVYNMLCLFVYLMYGGIMLITYEHVRTSYNKAYSMFSLSAANDQLTQNGFYSDDNKIL